MNDGFQYPLEHRLEERRLWSAAEDTGLPISFHQGAGFWSTGRTNIPPGRGVDLIRITVVAALYLGEG